MAQPKFTSPKGLGDALVIKAESLGSTSMSGDAVRTPLLYLDPMFDQILLMFPQDNLRELNRRLRHYYKYDPIVRNCMDFHTEAPLSDFDLRCPENLEAQDYYNDFKDRKNLLNICMNMLRDYWTLGEAFVFGNWDADEQEYRDFIQIPPEEIEVHSAYVTTQRAYMLRPNKDITKMLRSSNIADRTIAEFIRKYNPQQARQMAKNRPYPLDPNRLLVMQRESSGYNNRGISPIMAVLKDLMYQDFLNMFRTVFIQRHAYPLRIFKIGSVEKGFIPNKKFMNDFRCFSEDTELLTEDGFKRFDQLNGERFATLNPTTNMIEHHPAKDIFAYPYAGNMINFKNIHCDLLVTPNHNMWAQRARCKESDGRQLMRADTINTEVRFQSVITPDNTIDTTYANLHIDKYDVRLEHMLELAGYYISEGWGGIVNSSPYKGKKYPLHRIQILQTEKSKDFNLDIQTLIPKLPFHVGIQQKNREKSSRHLYHEFHGFVYCISDSPVSEWIINEFGRLSHEKCIPSWVKSLPPRFLKILLDAAILGAGSDGHSNYKEYRNVHKLQYHTVSKRLADDIQEMCLKLGYHSTITKCKMGGESFEWKHQKYTISINTLEDRHQLHGPYPVITAQHRQLIAYDGLVWCVDVPPHHLVIARRNGRIVVTGNSQLLQSINDPNYNLITHPFVTVESHTGHDKILNLIPQYDLVKSRILIGLFASESVISGEKTPFAAGVTYMRALMSRYLTVRNNLENELKQKIFAPLAVKRGFIDAKNRPILPKFFWHKANLLSSQAIQTMLINLRDKGEIPFGYIAELFGFDTEDVKYQFKHEEGTRVDPLWRKARDESILKSKVARQAYLEGKSVEDALKAAIESGEKLGEEKPEKTSGLAGGSRKLPVPTEAPTGPIPEEIAEATPPKVPGAALPAGVGSPPGEGRTPRPGETPEGGGA